MRYINKWCITKKGRVLKVKSYTPTHITSNVGIGMDCDWYGNTNEWKDEILRLATYEDAKNALSVNHHKRLLFYKHEFENIEKCYEIY